MRNSTVADIVRAHGGERPEAPAIIYGEAVLTYGDLEQRSNRLANGLLAEGIKPEDRVAWLDKNAPEYFELIFGAAKVNAVICAVNWRLNPREAAFIINDAEAKVLVVGEELLPTLTALRGALRTVKKILVVGDDSHESYGNWLSRQPASDPGVEQDADHVAFQFYSSGTTGRPKGVMLSNRNCFAWMDANNERLKFGPQSVNHVVMPLFHVAGGFRAMLGLYKGAKNVVMRNLDPLQIVLDIERHGITHTVMVPALLHSLLGIPETKDAEFSSLEVIVYGGSPISEEVLRASMRTFGCRFMQAYGLTETSGGCVLLPPEDHDPDGPRAHRLRSAGKPGPGTELRVVDPDTLEDLPTGSVGEVLVRSPQNMKGYWKMPEATAETLLSDGWLRTGDAGYLDEDAYLYIHDRVKDMIISGGENVYPAEIENLVMSHPAVADVAVIGVPDRRWGETPKAIVVKAVGAEVDEMAIIEFARQRLAHYKCPTSVEFRATLPRTPSGKLLKKELREPYWDGRERRVH